MNKVSDLDGSGVAMPTAWLSGGDVVFLLERELLPLGFGGITLITFPPTRRGKKKSRTKPSGTCMKMPH